MKEIIGVIDKEWHIYIDREKMSEKVRQREREREREGEKERKKEREREREKGTGWQKRGSERVIHKI